MLEAAPVGESGVADVIADKHPRPALAHHNS
jgi:hypothetical protein